jgi:hypothetical protein
MCSSAWRTGKDPFRPGTRRGLLDGMSPSLRSTCWVAAALVVPAATALALLPAEASLGNAAVAQLLVVPVVLIAASGRRLVTSLAALSAAVAFDVVHTEPRGSLAIARSEDLAVMVALLAVGLIVAQVAAFALRQGETAGRTLADMSVVRTVGEMVAAGEDVDLVARTSALWLRDMLTLRDSSMSWDLTSPSPASVEPGGTVRMGDLLWSAETQGLPGPSVDVPVHDDGAVIGRLVLVPSPGVPVLRDRLITASALADLIGMAHGAARARHPDLPAPAAARADDPDLLPTPTSERTAS